MPVSVIPHAESLSPDALSAKLSAMVLYTTGGNSCKTAPQVGREASFVLYLQN